MTLICYTRTETWVKWILRYREVTRSIRPRVIAGFGRSGTTWLQDVLGQANSLRTVFEPLHPAAIRGAAQYAHTFLEKDDVDEGLYRLLHRYFFEEFRSVWADYRVRSKGLYPRKRDLTSLSALRRTFKRISIARKYYFRYRSQRRHEQRIIKLVRANMILSWLQERLDARIVFIIRHPAAVVLSQLKSPRSWNPNYLIGRYRENPRLLDYLEDDVRQLLFQPLDSVEALSLSWCIENEIALKQAQESEILVVYFEEILERGQPEWRRILSALDLLVMPDFELISRPSQQAWGERARDPALIRRHASWMDDIDSETATRMQNMLDATGMDVYSMDQALPVVRS